MQTIQLGLPFMKKGLTFTVTSLRLEHQQVVCEAANGAMLIVQAQDFMRQVAEGELTILARDQNRKLQPVPTDWQAREKERARIERIKRETLLKVEHEATSEGDSLRQAHQKIAALCHANSWPVPSERTLRNWRKAKGSHAAALSPKWARCGNRHQGPDEPLLDAMVEVVDCTIFNQDRFTITSAWRHIEAKYAEICANRGITPRRHTKNKLTRFIKSVNREKLLHLQLDNRTARAITRTAVKVHGAERAWDLVEMDASTLDLLVRDEHGNEIGRPTLYAAIDVCSGYPLGLHLSIQKPSAQSFVDCVRYMYYPKPDEFDKRHGIQHRLEAYGKPVNLKVDNGSEFTGSHATILVERLFGDISRCKPYTPQEKPVVERFFGVIREYVRTLPGSIISAAHKDRRTLPKSEQLLTIEQLRSRLFRFIYDDYCMRPNEMRSWRHSKAVAPYDIWQDCSENFFPPFSPPLAEFNYALYYMSEMRKLNHTGISFDGLTYHSDDLAKLYGQFGPITCKVLYSDLDANSILIETPDGSSTIAAYAKELGEFQTDRPTAKEIGKKLREQSLAANARTYERLNAELKELQAEAKTSRSRNRQARAADLSQRAAHAARATAPRHTSDASTINTRSNAPVGSDWVGGNSIIGRKRGS